jgi:hypothetical protein
MPSRIKIDWTQTHHCESCEKELCRRTTKAEDRNGRVRLGMQTETGYQCRICQEREDRWGKGTKPMNRAEKSEDGLSQKCNRCDNWHTYESGMYRTTRYGYRTTCKECDADTDRTRREKDPEAHRLKFIKHRYGVDYASLLLEQQGTCAICETDTPNNGRKTFDVDHDHTCCAAHQSCGNCVRGLLCSYCNMLIGMYKEDLTVIETLHGGSKWGDSAVEYLTK